MQSTLSLHYPLSPGIASQHRQYLLSARQRTSSLIHRLQLKLIEVEEALAQQHLLKRERRRLSHIRWKTNRTLENLSNEMANLETSLADLQEMQLQTARSYPTGMLEAGHRNCRWVWNGTCFVEQMTTDNFVDSNNWGYAIPQWQGQSLNVAMILPVEFHGLENSPTAFRYPFEQNMYDDLPEQVSTAHVRVERSGSAFDDNDVSILDLQTISPPGFEKFAWPQPQSSPRLWVETNIPSTQGQSHNVSPFTSPRTINRPGIPPAIVTSQEPVSATGAPGSAQLRGDAPVFTPSLAWSCPVTPKSHQSSFGEELSTKEENRRYSAAAVDLIEYRLRHPSHRFRGKRSRYGRNACTPERESSVNGYRKSGHSKSHLFLHSMMC